MGVGVADIIVAREHIVRSGGVPGDQPRRNAGGAQQHSQRAGEQLTRSLMSDKQKLIHGIGTIWQERRLQRIREAVLQVAADRLRLLVGTLHPGCQAGRQVPDAR